MTAYEGIDIGLIVIGGFSAVVGMLVGVIYRQSTKRMDSQHKDIVTLFERIRELEQSAITKDDLKDALEPLKDSLDRLVHITDSWSSGVVEPPVRTSRRK